MILASVHDTFEKPQSLPKKEIRVQRQMYFFFRCTTRSRSRSPYLKKTYVLNRTRISFLGARHVREAAVGRRALGLVGQMYFFYYSAARRRRRISFLGLVQGPGHGAPALEAEYVVLDFQLALERTRFNGIQLDSAVFIVFVSVALTRCSELTAPP